MGLSWKNGKLAWSNGKLVWNCQCCGYHPGPGADCLNCVSGKSPFSVSITFQGSLPSVGGFHCSAAFCASLNGTYELMQKVGFPCTYEYLFPSQNCSGNTVVYHLNAVAAGSNGGGSGTGGGWYVFTSYNLSNEGDYHEQGSFPIPRDCDRLAINPFTLTGSSPLACNTSGMTIASLVPNF